MVNVDQNFDAIGVSEIIWRDKKNNVAKTGLVSGMMFISGARLFYVSGSTLTVLNPGPPLY